MTSFAARFVPLALRVALAGSMIGLALVIALVHLAPQAGRGTFIVRGASMEPVIPVGALIVVAPDPAGQYAAGDVVSLRSGQSVVTHRVVGVETVNGDVRLQTRGDANDAADAAYAAPSDVIGRVELSLPVAGIVLAFAGQPVGIIAIMSFLGTLLFAMWLVEDTIATRRETAAPRGITGEAAA